MYSAFANHLEQLAHYFFTFGVLFFAIPRLFINSPGPFLDRFWQDYSKVVLVLILLGYLLVILRLYEIISLACIFMLIYFYSREKESGLRRWESFVVKLQVLIFDYADGLFRPKRLIQQGCKVVGNRLERVAAQAGSVTYWTQTILTLTVFSYAVFLRFYEAMRNAAPAMSDSYVVLAWLKYIDKKLLFHDGIYPQGFHIYLDFLYKFSGIDALYVVNYSGPLHSMLIVFGLFYVVYRLTDRKGPAFVTAISYGLLGQYFVSGWMRHSATNSQEFAFIFIFPALYFLILYLQRSQKEYLYVGFIATALIGLVHTLAFVYLGLGMGALILAALIANFRDNLKKTIHIAMIGLFSVLCALIPVGIGLLMGKSFFSASAEFLTGESATAQIPTLGLFDWLALLALLAILCYLIAFRKKAQELLAFKFMFLYGLGSLFLYLFGGVLTKNLVIASRAGELWSLVIPVCLGLGWYALSQIISPLARESSEGVILLALVSYTLFQLQPQPIQPYRMEPNSYVEQYLRINSTLRPTEWMIVSQIEGYSLVYGKGYHMMLTNFLREYDPKDEQLTDRQGNSLKTPDIFIYQEKVVYRGIDATNDPHLEAIYQRREEEKEAIGRWIAEYKKSHTNIKLFYEDDYVIIWQISQPLDREEVFRRIWED